MVSQDFAQLRERLNSVANPVDFLVALFSHAPDAFSVWKPDGHALLVNAAYRELFGSEPPPEYNIRQDEIARQIGVLDLIERAFAGETTHIPTNWYDPRELRQVQVPLGKRVAISLTVFPLTNAAGTVQYVVVTYKDETEAMLAQERLQAETENLQAIVQQMVRDAAERRRAEQALSESEQRFRALIQNSADVILLLDAGNTIRFASPSVERVLGYLPQELVGRPISDFLDEAERESLRRHYRKMVGWPGEPMRAEQSVRRKDGSRCVLEVTATDLLDDPAVKAVVVNYHDVTERWEARQAILALNVELENRVRERTAALEAANKELESFAYSVSHDLRAPLRSIQGFSQILLEDFAGQLEPMALNYLKRVSDGGKAMNQLIDDLLKLSRLTRSAMSRTQVDLSALADEIVQGLRAGQPERAVEVVIQPGLTANADANLLRVLLVNLLDNAWKYTSRHDHARIEVGCTEQDGEPVFFVRDDGAGFDMAYADKLFGVFQRLHTASEFEGTGIGLATVQRIVNRHGGKVWTQAAVEQGATFYFTLP